MGPLQHALFELNVDLFEPEVDLAQLLDETLVFAFQLKALGGLAQDLNQLVHAPGLEEVTVDLAAVDGLNRVLQLREAGHEQTDRPGRDLADPLEQLNAAHRGHLLVGKDKIDGLLGEDFAGFFAGIGGEYLKIRGEQGGQRGQDVWLIIDHEQRAFLVRTHVRGPGSPLERTGASVSNQSADREGRSLFGTGCRAYFRPQG